MAMPDFSMRQLLEAGVHFGHHTRRWNPKMEQFIFGVRNNTHIIDLQQTVPLLEQALLAVREVAARGGRVLFVGTKRQASLKVAEAAGRCGQYYVDHRWLGGMLTNWKTISNSIRRLKDLEEQFSKPDAQEGLTKKELLQLTREHGKLHRALGGIKGMGGLPDILVIIDTNKEAIAVAEARKLKIPVVAVIDSNSNPDGVDYPIPGNDDSLRAITLYCELMADSVLDGLSANLQAQGGDAGAAAEPLPEKLPEPEAAPVEAAPAAAAEAVPATAAEAAPVAAAEAAPAAAAEAAPAAAAEAAPVAADDKPADDKATEEKAGA